MNNIQRIKNLIQKNLLWFLSLETPVKPTMLTDEPVNTERVRLELAVFIFELKKQGGLQR